MSNILVFDTETTSLNKPFCYNVGYVIYDTEKKEVIKSADYVIEQVWHNEPLFSTAYYAEKRPIYVSKMRGRKATMKKWGHVMRAMITDIKNFDIQGAFAYNSSFDEKVFNFNCDYFHTNNPFDTIPIFDIRGHVMKTIAFTKDFQEFCETNKFFTEKENYSTTAEVIYRYLTQDLNFVEAHTALSDAEIETFILQKCVDLGAEFFTEYKVYRTVPRNIDYITDYKKLKVYINNELLDTYLYQAKTFKNDSLYLQTKAKVKITRGIKI